MKKIIIFGILLGTFLRVGDLHAYNLKVMSFNIFRGGLGRIPSIIKFIKREKPDIIGIQEAWFSLSGMASELGYHYDYKSSILSRYPIVSRFPGRGFNHRDGILIQIPEKVSGKEKETIGFFNIHLPPYPYTPYLVRDGRSPNESHRLKEIDIILNKVKAQNFDFVETPVFLVGDLNTVSHRDWEDKLTPEELPVTVSIERQGFKDAYRTLYPDSTLFPGNTWTPKPDQSLEETSDRIDYIFFKGPLTIVKSRVHDGPVGEKPWPSDHRAVTATFSLDN